jgi:uncharacterized protein involved in exopolysaccharide biosynthesis
MNQAAPHPNLDRIDEINILELAQRMLARWPIIVACMMLTSLAGVLTLRYSTYTYTAELKVTPVQANAQGSLSQLGQLSGLASLVGVALPRSDATPFFLYVESVASRAVADQLATDPELMKRVFKSEWDASTNRYVERVTTFGSIANSLRELLGIPVFPWTPPDGARLQIYLQSSVEVSEDTRKPIVTLRYDHEDPAFAAAFLATLDRAIDSELRKKTLDRVNENIAYLSQQLTTVRLAEHRQAIIDMLSEQEKSRMMASSTAPIAAETVSGPTSSFRPTKPRQLLVIAATVLAGFLLGCILALAWDWFAHRRRRVPSGAIVPAPPNLIPGRLES